MTPATQAEGGDGAQGRAPVVRFSGVTKSFSASALPAIEDVTFDVGEGRFVSVIGPSGCG